MGHCQGPLPRTHVCPTGATLVLTTCCAGMEMCGCPTTNKCCMTCRTTCCCTLPYPYHNRPQAKWSPVARLSPPVTISGYMGTMCNSMQPAARCGESIQSVKTLCRRFKTWCRTPSSPMMPGQPKWSVSYLDTHYKLE